MTGLEWPTAADIYSLGRLLEKMIIPGAGDAELRAIIALATAEDPARRYATVDALRADVAAWGDHMPVAAMEGGRAYTVRKFVRRHRLGVFSTAAAAALVGGALGATWQAYSVADTARTGGAKRVHELRDLAHYKLVARKRVIEGRR